LDNSSWFVWHPGTREERRTYPKEHFIAAVKLILEAWPGKVVVTGSKEEIALANEVVHELGDRGVSLAGQLSLGELAALIRLSPLLVSSNTGPVHLSAAVGTPVVDVYAKTNMQHTPWQVPATVLFYDVPCKLCERGICPARISWSSRNG
jgi:ADP-heptose:LPS heptosyltransferase